MKFEIQRTISAAHPSLPGHFPNVPIVPGVVILDEIAAALTTWRGDVRLSAIRLVKFLQPLPPEQPFIIALSAEKNDEIDFTCRVGEAVVAEGRLQVHSAKA